MAFGALRCLAAAALCVAAGAAAPATAAAAPADDCASRPAPAAVQRGFAEAARAVAPAVVTVLVLRAVQPDAGSASGFQSMAGLPLPGGADANRQERSFSSGFVIGAGGAIVSSAHAVARADSVFVTLADGRRLPARVVGMDARNDVALLKVDAELPAVRIAVAPACAGDVVAALGTPFGFERSVTAGVVSAAARLVPGMQGVPLIQTDVALNPGSSGGPLFDADGAVVGLASMIFSDTGVYMGVSFAVPIDRVLRVVASLARGPRRGDIGVLMQPVSPDLARAFGLAQPAGALVTRVRTAGTAAAAGLRPGDVVLAVDGRAAADQSEVEDAIAAAPERGVELELWRDGARRRAVLSPTREAGAAPSAPREERAQERQLGLTLVPAPAAANLPAGVYVDAATGSALLAGIEHGDRISAVNGTEVSDARSFDAALARAASADVVALLVWRSGDPLYIAVRRIAR